MARVPKALRALIRARANDICEYCQMPQRFYKAPFQPDHIIAEKHRGPTTQDNLAWACYHCNLFKGDNLAGIDPQTGAGVFLFNPRRQLWRRHFRWVGPLLYGRTAVGRATIEVLNINDLVYVQTRTALIDEGVFPPELDRGSNSGSGRQPGH